MPRPRRVAATLLALLTLLVVVAAGAYVVRNPERDALDDAARRAAPGRFVTLADGVVHYRQDGPAGGVPVVLVHGFSVPSYIWDSTAAGLAAAGFRVLRYDLYGRGWSDRPDVQYDAALLDRQLAALLDSLGVRAPAHVVGLSMGGWVSATFAGRHPERVRSLTLVDPIASRRAALPAPLRAPLLGPALWQALAVPGMAEGQSGDFHEPARFPDWADRYRVQMRYRGFGRALRSTITALAAADVPEAYRRVGRRGTPVLLVWGTEDRVVPFALSDSVRRWIPRAEFHAIERAGHLPHMERAEVVNPILVGFLRRVDSASVVAPPPGFVAR
jgi:pimeloyl-ACP methyl ester carboxylesterase